jgi:hypothetical protein
MKLLDLGTCIVQVNHSGTLTLNFVKNLILGVYFIF